jgi:hypothetical protein
MPGLELYELGLVLFRYFFGGEGYDGNAFTNAAYL